MITDFDDTEENHIDSNRSGDNNKNKRPQKQLKQPKSSSATDTEHIQNMNKMLINRLRQNSRRRSYTQNDELSIKQQSQDDDQQTVRSFEPNKRQFHHRRN